MKQTISIIIIVFAIGGAAVFGYMALNKSGGGSSATAPAVGATSSILPMGSTMKFDTIQKYNKDSRLFDYPVVSQSEVGTTTNELMLTQTPR